MANTFLKITPLVLVLLGLQLSLVHAETEPDVDQQATQMEEIKNKDEAWTQQLKEKYSLTDEQIKTLHDSGLSYPQLAMAAQLSKSSQKPLDEILKMRNEQKMGWGRIAKELGIHPKEIGQSVRDMRHALRDERKVARNERKEKAAQRKEERKNKHAKKDH